MQVKFVMSINEHVMISSDQRSSMCHQTGNYKIFQKCRQNSRRFPVFPISRRFLGVVARQVFSNSNNTHCDLDNEWTWRGRSRRSRRRYSTTGLFLHINSSNVLAMLLERKYINTVTLTTEHQGPNLQNILQLSYDNAKITIDLRRTSNLQNI